MDGIHAAPIQRDAIHSTAQKTKGNQMNTHDIKRYSVSGDIAYPVHEDPEGDYVTYEDHVAAIEADRQRRGEPVPKGWKLVPETPTSKQIVHMALQIKGADADGWFRTDGDDWPEHVDAAERAYKWALSEAPQPAENSVNLEVAIQAISALHSNDTDWDTSYWNQAVGRCVSELNKLRSQQPAEPDSAKCAECGAEMIHVRPGKWQHPDCPQSPRAAEPVACFKCGHAKHGGECVNVAPQPAEPSRGEPVAYAAFADNGNIRTLTLSAQEAETIKERDGIPFEPLYRHPTVKKTFTAAEPVKVPSDAEMAAIWDEANKPFGGAPFLMSHVEYSRALLARYGWPAKEPSKDEIRAILLKHGYTVKPGHDDLKPYVYAAARELIAFAQGREP